MDSIKQDAKRFHQDVKQLTDPNAVGAMTGAAAVTTDTVSAVDPDMNALFATLDQAVTQEAPLPTSPTQTQANEPANNPANAMNSNLIASAEQLMQQPMNAMNAEPTTNAVDIDADLAAIDALFTEATTTQPTSEELSTSPAAFAVSAAAEEIAADPMEAALTELIASASQPQSEAPIANVIPTSADETDEIIELTGDLELHPDHQIIEGVDIAAALDAAAAKLGQLTADVQETMDVDDSFLATPPASKANRSMYTPTYSQMISHETTTTPLPSFVSASSPSAHQSPAAEVRRQIQETRTRILSELDEVLVALDRLDQMQIQADMTLQRAQEFEKAAVHTQQTAEALLQAETEAADAQAAYDQAQQRVSAARNVWEQARQATARAAAAVTGRQ